MIGPVGSAKEGSIAYDVPMPRVHATAALAYRRFDISGSTFRTGEQLYRYGPRRDGSVR